MHTRALAGAPIHRPIFFSYSKTAMQFAAEASGELPAEPISSISQAYPRENDLMAAADQPILIASASDGLSLPLPLDAFL